MKILCIGNSFSQDAARYLSPAAKNQGIDIFVENLYIGGCSLERHYNNMLKSEQAYEKEINGESTREFVSLNEELQNKNWDVVTIQQASHFSYNYETYEPYATELVRFIRKNQPTAKVFIHFTWAYEDNSQRLFENGFSTRKEMFEKVKESYHMAFKACGADGIIPSGQVFENLAEKGLKCHRDTFHATLGAGRYALALTWIKSLTGADISANTFNETDEPLSEEEIIKIKEAVNEAFEK